jgi:benzil reductase ((S)-benzoin forming)
MTQQHLTLVTGASRGLGRGIALALVDAGHTVLGLSRQAPEAPFEQWAVDLAEPGPVAERLAGWLAAQPADRFASASLVNNAALLVPPGPLGDADPATVAAAVRVGVEAPILLAAAFLRATAGWSARRRVLHVSSGLGRRAMAGSAVYCATKAALDHLARAQALEEAQRPNGARVVSLAPGVIDTDMQVQLRGADARAFPDRANFVALKEGGKLDSAETAGAKVAAYLLRDDFGREPVADVRG